MIWQDAVFTVGGFLLTINLLPTVLNSEAKVPLATSALTALVLYVYAGTMASLGLHYSAVMNLATAAFWTFIAFYRRP